MSLLSSIFVAIGSVLDWVRGSSKAADDAKHEANKKAAEEEVAKREDILDAVWGDVVVDTHTVDNFVSALKKKLKADGAGFELKTVRGVGFRLLR